MSQSSSNTISNELLAKYFAGETTMAESNQVKEWADSSPDNAELMYRIRIIWLDTGQIKINKVLDQTFDIDAALKNVLDSKRKVKSGTSIKNYWQIAASVVILIGIGWIIQLNSNEVPLVVVNADENISTIQLEDGTAVTLNQESTLSYPEVFNSNERRVILSGEAFFEVDHQPERPFIVELGKANVKVLGTTFNIDSRPNMDTITVWLETGKVILFTESDKITLTPGQKGYYIKSKNIVSLDNKTAITGVDQFWRTHQLVFNGQKLPDVLASISQAYGIQFELENVALNDCSIAVTFNDESLDNVLEIIQLTLDLEITNENGVFRISGTGCQND